MKKTFKKIHLWLSVPFGLVITTLCLTGAVLVFESEIMQLIRKNTYKVKQIGTQTIAIQELIEEVQSTLNKDVDTTITSTSNNPIQELIGEVKSTLLVDEVEVTGITVFRNPAQTYQISLSKPHRASIYINQYTGEIQGGQRAPFFLFMFRLHRWLLGSPRPNTEGGIAWGKTITGVSTLIFIFVLISGLIIWLPRTAKTLKNRISIVTNKGIKRFWYDLHVSAGFWAFALLLIMAVTGLTYSFTWYRTAFYKIFGAELVQRNNKGDKPQTASTLEINPAKKSSNRAENPDIEEEGWAKGSNKNLSSVEVSEKSQNKYASWQKVLNHLKEQNPTFHKISINARGASVNYGGWGNQHAADHYKFDAHTGQITKITTYQNTTRADKLRGWIYTLHVGSWGGWISKLLTGIAALIGASLPITGYYFWLKRLTKKCKKN